MKNRITFWPLSLNKDMFIPSLVLPFLLCISVYASAQAPATDYVVREGIAFNIYSEFGECIPGKECVCTTGKIAEYYQYGFRQGASEYWFDPFYAVSDQSQYSGTTFTNLTVGYYKRKVYQANGVMGRRGQGTGGNSTNATNEECFISTDAPVLQFNITVTAEPDLTFNVPTTICSNGTPLIIQNLTNKSGKSRLSIYIDDVLQVISAQFNPAAYAPGSTHTLKAVYSFDNGERTLTRSITIKSPPTSTISASFPTDVCAVTGSTIDLNTFVSNPLPAGSTISFACVSESGFLCPTGVLASGVFNPMAQGGNSFKSKINVITTDPTGCQAIVQRTINVGKNFTITPGAPISVCKDAANVALGGTPANGSSNGESGNYTSSWSGAGVVSGTHFSPSSGAVTAGVSNTLTYSVTNNLGCSKTATRVATANALPSLSANNTNHIADCASGNIDLVATYGPTNSGTPITTGLTWSSNNATVNSKISGNILSLTGLATGNYNITFSYVNANGCTGNFTLTNGLIINLGAIAVPNANNVTNCGLNLSASLEVLSPDASVSYDWYDALTGGTLLHTGTTYSTPALSATKSYFVASRKASCVSSRKQINVTVVNTDVNAGPDYSSCSNSTGSVNLTGLNNPSPAGGTWTGPGVSGGNFNGGSLVNNASYDLIYTVNQFGCVSRDTINATLGFNTILTYTPSNTTYPGQLMTIKHNYPTAVKTIWQFGDGISLESLNGAHYYYSVGNKTVTVYIKQAGGCENTFTFNNAVTVLSPEVITQTEEAILPVEVYPVPFKTHLNILSEAAMSTVSIVLINALGVPVLKAERNLEVGQNSIFDGKVSDLHPGAYILVMQFGNTTKRVKLLKL